MAPEEAIVGGGEEETTAAAVTTGSESGSSAPASPRNKVKLLCSHGGKILPRPTDGHLKYVGGETRIVSFPRDINFSVVVANGSRPWQNFAYTMRMNVSVNKKDMIPITTAKLGWKLLPPPIG